MKFRIIIWLILIQVIWAQTFPSDTWELIRSEPLYSVSGLAQVGNKIWVVHDNKRPDQPRLGYLEFAPDKVVTYRGVPWPETAWPVDVEGLASLPGTQQMAALESSGKMTILQWTAQGTWHVVNHVQLPRKTPAENFEGLAFFRTPTQTLVFWADRGSDVRPATLYWGLFDAENDTVKIQGFHHFRSPWPTENVRHISGLDITPTGELWVSSVSDPGDDGPFQSAVYLLGGIRNSEKKEISIQFNDYPREQARYTGHKIEALLWVAETLWAATDDENQGASIIAIDLKQD